MKQFSIKPCPLTLEITRLEADKGYPSDPCADPTRLKVRVMRGGRQIVSADVFVGELLETGEDELSAREMLQAQGLIVAEWLDWNVEAPVDLARSFDALGDAWEALGGDAGRRSALDGQFAALKRALGGAA